MRHQRLTVLLLAFVLSACNKPQDGTPSGEPSQPAELKAIPAANHIDLSWKDTSDNETGFAIYRKNITMSEPSFDMIGNVTANIQTYRDETVHPEDSYLYGVAAVGGKLESSRAEITAPVQTEAPRFLLSILRQGSGSGVVRSEPAGIACNALGENCQYNFLENIEVALFAEPDEDSDFTGWQGDCKSTETCTLTMNRAKTVTASFEEARATLSVTVVGNGKVKSISPSGIDCGEDCSESFRLGTRVGLEAISAAGSSFADWSEPCQTDSRCLLTLTETTTLTATFSQADVPVITFFKASPESLEPGESSELSWQVEGADSLNLSKVGDVSGKTSVTVSPSEDTTYTLTATNSAGSSQAVITVAVGRIPEILSFTAAKTSIFKGDSVMLSWSAVGSRPISLFLSDGATTEQVIGDSISVSPDSTRSYTLKAQNAYGNDSSSLTIEVKERPLVNYELTVIHEGDARVVSVQPDNGIRCGTDCSEKYKEGTEVELRVAKGRAKRWSGCDETVPLSDGDEACLITLNSDRTITVKTDDD